MANDISAPTEKKAKKPRGTAPKRPAYIVYVVRDAAGQVLPDASLEIVTATRQAKDVLSQTAGQVEKRYSMFEI